MIIFSGVIQKSINYSTPQSKFASWVPKGVTNTGVFKKPWTYKLISTRNACCLCRCCGLSFDVRRGTFNSDYRGLYARWKSCDMMG